MRLQHVVIVPVKSPSVGKSRLRVPGHARPGLAAAFARDVVDAALRAPSVVRVVVMTPDDAFAASCREAGVLTVPDGDGLNHGLRLAARRVSGLEPDAVPVALCADLPCLRPGELGSALAQVGREGARYVVDAEGTGTTLFGAPYDLFDPRFGPGSARAHHAAGGVPVEGDLATVRRDVDDESDLAEAVELGVGAHTSAALAAVAG